MPEKKIDDWMLRVVLDTNVLVSEVQRIIVALMRTAEVVSVKSKLVAVREDPKDNMVIETAYD